MRTLRGEADGKGLKIGVVISRFNEPITDRLLEGALRALDDCGVQAEDITVVSVPGAIEIPGVARKLAGQVDAIVTLGAVVRGETEHFTYVCKAAQEGMIRVALDSGVPMTFGVLTTENSEQALARTGGAKGHKGYEVAMDAVELANTYKLIG
ncbi:MAG TPA: 6,7-dimethyl-8-ribityllumazine synthase [Actinomycetota bacterium]|nr:6,7-dimethyl-8-ribityllumazine synthase [Actinomycetota bacterium]